MYQRSYNRAIVRVRVTTASPLLIRAGDTGLAPTAAALACVRTRHGVYGSTVYIPGSSLKGVVRQAAEGAVRGRTFTVSGQEIPGACDPLDHGASCYGKQRGGREAGRRASHEVYAGLCLACRTFGSLALRGRSSVRDLFPWDDASPEGEAAARDQAAMANRTEVRNGVAISRVTGSVAHGPFDQEVVPAGVSFWGEVALENFQLWQLGLVMHALDELDAGFARLGSSTSRGLGEVRVAVESIVHEQALSGAKRPAGVGFLADAKERARYTLFAEAPMDVAEAGELRGLVERFTTRAPEPWKRAALGALGGLR
jgi:CRISPR-associated protein Csm3